MQYSLSLKESKTMTSRSICSLYFFIEMKNVFRIAIFYRNIKAYLSRKK